MEHVIIPVHVGMGKSGKAKSGRRNVQVGGDLDNLYRLRRLAARCADLPGCEVDEGTITRQLLDLYPGEGVCEGTIGAIGTTLYLYREGDDAALSAIRRRVSAL